MKYILKNIILLLLLFSVSLSAKERLPAVSGRWYPDNKAKLTKDIKSYFDQAKLTSEQRAMKPFAVIAPHAGFIYSGPVAVYSYYNVDKYHYDTVILIGSSHHYNSKVISVYNNNGYKTPLGTVPIDKEITKEILKASPSHVFEEDIHTKEHSLEAQIPFLQYRMKNKKFKIVPILTASTNLKQMDKLADTLINILQNSKKKILIAVSTDMSHYHKYDRATYMDKKTTEVIVQGKWSELKSRIYAHRSELCGFYAVYTLAKIKEKLGKVDGVLLKYANSGDTVPSSRGNGVVGYMAVIFEDKQKPSEKYISKSEKQYLLKLVRKSIIHYLKTGKELKPEKPESKILNLKRAVFVTLKKKNKDLRGCIGHMHAKTNIYKAVAQMAVSAATKDPRFKPVTRKELKNLQIEISILTPMERINSIDEITIKKHGVWIKKGMRSGVFLPQVADETGWDKITFLEKLCKHKAGLSKDCYKDPSAEIYKYQVILFEE